MAIHRNVELFLRFYTFENGACPQRGDDIYQSWQDVPYMGVALSIMNQAVVQLDEFRRQLPQTVEAGVALAKTINGNAIAQITIVFYGANQLLVILDLTVRNLDYDAMGGHGMSMQNTLKHLAMRRHIQ